MNFSRAVSGEFLRCRQRSSRLRTFFIFNFFLFFTLSSCLDGHVPTQRAHPKLDYPAPSSSPENQQNLQLTTFPPVATEHQPPIQIRNDYNEQSNSRNQLAKVDHKQDYIFLNTIDGHLYAVGKHDGVIRWSHKEDAVLQFPKNYNKPHFLTDPRDGSLYIFTNQRDGLKKFPYTIAELVSASPSKSSDGYLYTGDKYDQWLAIDYLTGHKLDTLTSESLATKISLSDENVVFIGRTKYTISMFDMATRKRVFNLTYYDYSTHASKNGDGHRFYDKPRTPNSFGNHDDMHQFDQTSNYPYYHFSSSSDGTLVTIDKDTGEFKWRLKLDFPIVAMYQYVNEQLYKINFAIFAIEALASNSDYNLLYAEQRRNEQRALMPNQQQHPSHGGAASTVRPPNTGNGGSTNTDQPIKAFTSTLYIGFFKNTLYALPAYVYNSQYPNLIEGPSVLVPFPSLGNASTEENNSSNSTSDPSPIDTSGPDDETSALIINIPIGHRPMPEKFDVPSNYIQPNNPRIDVFGGQSQDQCLVDDKKTNKKSSKVQSWINRIDMLLDQHKIMWTVMTIFLASILPLSKMIYDRVKKRRKMLQKQQQINENGEQHHSRSSSSKHKRSSSLRHSSDDYSTEDEGSNDKVARIKEVKFNSNESSSSKPNNSNTEKIKTNGSQQSFALQPEIDENGIIKIGKISYDPQNILGHGCAGTFVYKGTFENRPVAVKRLLPQCYTLADREVELLRDADQHANVLRYFCTESDVQFRYIALELCNMTLYDYVNKKGTENVERNLSTYLTILEQATRGLSHLHKLDIVHRDIKPQNVLLSFPTDPRTNITSVVAMISDFGLCKRLEFGNNSFSKRSGITGTEGWIAPELVTLDVVTVPDENDEEAMLNVQRKRVTKAVDIFSLGCVYYFVLSEGNHPFGDSIRRQANILSNEYKLDKFAAKLISESYVQKVIIEKMISHESIHRPNAKELLAHPIFWSKAKVLQFLQDVSDRIEKIEPDDAIVLELEKNANVTLKNNWKMHICPPLQNDLKKFRTYNGVSVRDLLRAIRNKKHHYRELPQDVKQSLGSLPDEFVDYFTYRFPKLVVHVYEAMKCCYNEPMINVYYDK